MCSAAFTCGEIAPSSLSCNAAVVESTRPKSTTNFLQKENARKNKLYVPQHCKCCGAGVGIDKAMKLYGRSIANAAKRMGIDKAMKLYGRSIANAAKRRIDKAMKLYGRSIANAAKRGSGNR